MLNWALHGRVMPFVFPPKKQSPSVHSVLCIKEDEVLTTVVGVFREIGAIRLPYEQFFLIRFAVASLPPFLSFLFVPRSAQ